MIIAHYAHRLPSNYDVGLIRARAKQRGPEWDATPELHFKGFMLRERGRHGILANEYSSLYLWRRDEGLRDVLLDGRFRVVTDSFGRPDIQTAIALDARKGHGRDARFAYKEELDIPRDTDIATIGAQEVERNRSIAGHPATVATAVAVDPRSWKLIRVLLSENEPNGSESGASYEILYLAKPLLETLPNA
jgi:hypothetical protein